MARNEEAVLRPAEPGEIGPQQDPPWLTSEVDSRGKGQNSLLTTIMTSMRAGPGCGSGHLFPNYSNLVLKTTQFLGLFSSLIVFLSPLLTCNEG